MRKYLSEQIDEQSNELLSSPQQIIFNVYKNELKWAFTVMLFGLLVITAAHELTRNMGSEMQIMRVTVLIPLHIFTVVLMTWKPSVRNLGISFAAIMIVNILILIWHMFGNHPGYAHNLMLYSWPYLTLAACTFSIIPRVIITLIPLYCISLLALFFQTMGQFDPTINVMVLLSFVFSFIALCFIAIVFSSTDRRITKSAENQRAQLAELSFTEALLNFALKETKQTIIFQDETGIKQHPAQNEFTEITKSLKTKTTLPSAVLGALTQRGFQAANMQDFTTEQTPDLRVLNDPNGRSYFTKLSETPTGIQTVLLTDVTRLVRTAGLLNAALNGNKIGVSCYDETGQLLMSRGAIPSSIPNEIRQSLDNLKCMIFDKNTKRTHASNFPIGDKFYDISFMRYGELNLVTHVDVTTRVQVENELRASHKMSIIGELSSGIAHDYNNVLSIILSNAELISVNDAESKFEDEISTLVDCIEHASGISKKLLSIASKQEPVFQRINVAESISAMSSLITSAIGSRIKLHIDIEDDLFVEVVLQEFQTAILNIIMNSRFAIANKSGNIYVSAKRIKNEVALRISDDGPGIPSELAEKIFEPFFTTHTQEFSTGLGLSMVQSFMSSSNGHVRTIPSKRGAAIELTFPQEETAQSETAQLVAS